MVQTKPNEQQLYQKCDFLTFVGCLVFLFFLKSTGTEEKLHKKLQNVVMCFGCSIM